MSNGKIRYEKKNKKKKNKDKNLQKSYYLNTFIRKLPVVIAEKRLKCFFKGDRRGRVDDFGT